MRRQRSTNKNPLLAAATVAAVAFAYGLASRSAHADGAFPDSQTILAPTSQPQEVTLVTNFGLISSEDGGHVWTWSCEQGPNAYGVFYQLSPAPRRRLYAVADGQLVFSDDRSCGWTAAGGLLADQTVTDAFVDRAVADRVFAVGTRAADGGGLTNSVFRSTDAGATFDVRLYTAPSGMTVSGVEAASDGNTIFLTLTSALAPAAIIGRSIDGGQTWTLIDLSSQLGPGTLRLIAVDRNDARRVFLLWTDASGQALAVTTDAGATAAKPLVPDGTIKNFIQMTSGTVLVATEAKGIQSLFRSQDDLLTFQSVFKPPHARAFAERDGILYAATDNVHDGYAIGTSTDEGTTWQALMSYSAVNAIAACVKTSCQTTCAAEVGIGLWSAAVCSADAPSTSGAGGVGGSLTDAAVDGPADGGGGAGIAPGGADAVGAGGGNIAGATGSSGGAGGRAGRGPSASDGGGCSCAAERPGPTSGCAAAVLIACFLSTIGRQRGAARAYRSRVRR